ENNTTVFRNVFDLLMKLAPLWHEEAGTQPLISAKHLQQWFAGSSMRVQCRSHVFVLPHLVNFLGLRWGGRLFRLTDRIGRLLPFLRNHGGLIMVRGEKRRLARDITSPCPCR